MKPRSLEYLAFRLQHTQGIGNGVLHRILERIQEEKLDPSLFFDLDEKLLQDRFDVPKGVVLDRRSEDSLGEMWDLISRKNIQILVRDAPRYPRKLSRLLGNKAPPIIYALGNIELLLIPSVGFCGSRKASEKGLDVTGACAGLLAADKINIVSGYANGVDLKAHKTALEVGGTTTIVLAEGIFNFKLKEVMRKAIKDSYEQILILSEFPPRLSWKPYNAMIRNRTICALSDAMVVIESGLEGGTFEAGKTALELQIPLFCIQYAEPSLGAEGNQYFIQRGAHSLGRSQSGIPNLKKILEIVRGSSFLKEEKMRRESQLSLYESRSSF